MSIPLTGFCLEWHIKKSNAFKDILVNPMEEVGLKIVLRPWDGKKLDLEDIKNFNRTPHIFCQFPPPQEILSNTSSKLIWIPMWDHIVSKNQIWWNSLPKNLRIIAFSDSVYQKAVEANLSVLKVKYYPNPSHFPRVDFNQPLTARYWNRRGLYSSSLIKKICIKLNIERLIFIGELDPHIPKKLVYDFPENFGKVQVQTFPYMVSQEKYKTFLRETNVLIAPRKSEGVGMTFLEAMASGSVVFSYDAPTMNEYITHKVNGYLFDKTKITFAENVRRKLWHTSKFPETISRESLHELNASLNLRGLKNLNLKILGNNAVESITYGYEKWKNQLSEIKNFITEW